MRILLVEDNSDHRDLMRLALTGHSSMWEVEAVASGEEALCLLLGGEVFDLVFLDYSLPGRDGLEVLEEILRGEAPPPVVVVTGRGDEQVVVKVMKGGAYDYVVKGEGYLQRLPVVARRAVDAHRVAVERKRAERNLIETLQQLQETRDMLIQFEKHSAVGRLAAGVAHEILNPASIISSQLQFLEEENLSEPARENVKVCREQLKRIVKISRDLLQSSAKKPTALVGGDLRRVIEVGLQMTERRRKEDHVQVEYDPPPAVIPVKMERDRLVKVMVNLILNACDAMTGNHSKRMIIAVYRLEVSSMRPSVRLIVTDNGHGILAGELDKIFEPFFTRKDPGKGTGLGLSVSKGIIHEHGGTIHAENNDMGGASFIVELPLDHP